MAANIELRDLEWFQEIENGLPISLKVDVFVLPPGFHADTPKSPDLNNITNKTTTTNETTTMTYTTTTMNEVTQSQTLQPQQMKP